MNSDHVDVNSDHVDVNLDRAFYRSSPELSGEERDRVREVARDLLAWLRAMFTLDWQKTAQARARVQDAIEQVLDDELPPAYTPELFKAKAVVVFQHIHERYGLAA